MPQSKIEHYVIGWSNTVIKNRWIVLILCLAAFFSASFGVTKIEFDNNYRVFFSKDNPQLMAFERFQNVFSKSDNIMIVIKPNSENAFDRDTLQAVQYATKRSWKVPYSTKVDSITNFQHTYAEEDDLIVIDLVKDDPSSYSDEELAWRKEVALNDPLLKERLMATDGKTTGVNITIQAPGKSPMEVPESVVYAREIVKELKEKFPNNTYALSGMTMMNNAFSEAAMQDLTTLVPIMYGTLILMMFIFLRSASATLATVSVIGLASATAMGLSGWMGIKMTPSSSTAPTIILTLAIADSIHIIVSMLAMMKKGMTKNEAIVESLRVNFQPVFLTSLTTAIGFLSLNFSDAPPFRDLGNITAMGVVAAFIYSVTFLPAVLALLPIKTKQHAPDKHDAFEHFGMFVVGRYRLFLGAMVLVTVMGIAGMLKLESNDEFVKYFDDSVEFRRDSDFMMKHLSGIYLIEFEVPANGTQGVNDPEYLETVEKFVDWVEQRPYVTHVYTITDIMKRLNMNMHGDDRAFYRIPDDRELAAQYLLLYELSLPFGLDITDRVNVDKSSSRVTVTTKEISSIEAREFEEASVQWFKENAPEYMHNSGPTGPMNMFSHISERNIESMKLGNAVAFLLISLSIGLALKSVRLGLISLMPNILPALLSFGVWGYLVGQVNLAVATVAAVSLGIIVDDTVHMLSKYRRGRVEKNLAPREAIIYAFGMTGAPLTVTTIVLVIGFSILALSSFEINSSMGLLTALAIGLALILDFFLLPPLLLILDRTTSDKKRKS